MKNENYNGLFWVLLICPPAFLLVLGLIGALLGDFEPPAVTHTPSTPTKSKYEIEREKNSLKTCNREWCLRFKPYHIRKNCKWGDMFTQEQKDAIRSHLAELEFWERTERGY